MGRVSTFLSRLSDGIYLPSWRRGQLQFKKGPSWIIPNWFLIWGDPFPRSGWPHPLLYTSLARERLASCGLAKRTQNTVHRKRPSEPAEGSQLQGWWRILLFKTYHPTTGLSFGTDHLLLSTFPKSYPCPQDWDPCICVGYTFREPLDCQDITSATLSQHCTPLADTLCNPLPMSDTTE